MQSQTWTHRIPVDHLRGPDQQLVIEESWGILTRRMGGYIAENLTEMQYQLLRSRRETIEHPGGLFIELRLHLEVGIATASQGVDGSDISRTQRSTPILEAFAYNPDWLEPHREAAEESMRRTFAENAQVMTRREEDRAAAPTHGINYWIQGGGNVAAEVASEGVNGGTPNVQPNANFRNYAAGYTNLTLSRPLMDPEIAAAPPPKEDPIPYKRQVCIQKHEPVEK